QSDKTKVQEMIQVLQNGNDAQKVQAAVALADIGPDAKDAVPALVHVLSASSEDVRLNASIALGKIGAAAIDPVTKLLASDTAGDRYYAIWTLGWIGPPAKATAPLVIKALKD